MDRHALTCLALFGLLTSSIGCADDGVSDDDVGSDTDESTSTSEGTDTESESSDDTESSTSSTDTDESTSDTDDSTSSTDESTDSADTDTDESTDTEDTEETEDTGEPIMCPGVFPDFDKTCSVDEDCAVVVHTTDCCGNSVAWGINMAEVDAFDAAEAICDGQYPPCGCPQGPTIAEDGNAVFGPNELAVGCTMGSCMSFVPG